MPTVPNVFPKIPHPTYRLAIVGEAPGTEEEAVGQPFVGISGQLLRRVLGSYNLSAEQCFIGNVSQLRPAGNDIEEFDFGGHEITSGLAQLRIDLDSFRPNCTLLLGRTPLRAFCPDVAESDDKGNLNWSISNYRGSILDGRLSGLLPTGQTKCVPAYHPAYILRAFGDIPFFRWDVKRAIEQSAFPDIRRIHRNIHVAKSASEVEETLATIRAFKRPTGFDVEGWNDNVGITVLSVASSPTECLVIPFFLGGTHIWSESDEGRIWKAVAAYLEDGDCPKRVTNATYEQFILAWKHRIVIAGIADDTMFKHWELFPELEKSLAVQASVYTTEPYYKFERGSENADTKCIYNGKDSCVTTEVCDQQEALLSKFPKSAEHYRFNINLLPAVQYIMLRGCKFDLARAAAHKEEAQRELGKVNASVDVALGREFNFKSTKDKQWLLYTYFGYTPYKLYGETTKEEVLLRYYAKHREPILKQVIAGVSLRTRISDIDKLTTDADGRIRSNYNLVGTNTGRLSSSASNAMLLYHSKKGIPSWEQTGTNLQNVTKELRDCFISDSPEHAFFQCDLSGADGWTVAADLAALGNATMLDDYLAGIKPAKVLLLMLEEHNAKRDPTSINRLDRTTLRERTKALKFPDGRDEYGRPGDWLYLCMKRVQHGTNYDMQPELLSATIFKDSDGLIDLTTKEAALYQHLYKLRYNPELRKTWIRNQLTGSATLDSAIGIRRRFFGIRNPKSPDDSVVRSALSFEPQANTTGATNRALLSLWNDVKNRTSRNGLFIEPLLHTHDALAGQFKIRHAAWAIERIKGYFAHDLIIHGIKIRIPFEGGYGTDWLNCKTVEF